MRRPRERATSAESSSTRGRFSLNCPAYGREARLCFRSRSSSRMTVFICIVVVLNRYLFGQVLWAGCWRGRLPSRGRCWGPGPTSRSRSDWRPRRFSVCSHPGGIGPTSGCGWFIVLCDRFPIADSRHMVAVLSVASRSTSFFHFCTPAAAPAAGVCWMVLTGGLSPLVVWPLVVGCALVRPLRRPSAFL